MVDFSFDNSEYFDFKKSQNWSHEVSINHIYKFSYDNYSISSSIIAIPTKIYRPL